MSLFVRDRRQFQGVDATASDMIPARPSGRHGSAEVTDATAMRHSAVWACIRTRADLMASFPVDVFRRVGAIQVEMPKPPVLLAPGGKRWPYIHWMWATEADLDRCGNTFGYIVSKNALGLPQEIELIESRKVAVRQKKGETAVRYKVDGTEYTEAEIWHERQYPVSGLPVGMSPVAQAAYSIGEYLSIQEFALDWYASGGVPKARMRNTAKKLSPDEREVAKQWYRDTIANGDLLVTGLDWEYDMLQAEQIGMEWIEARKYGVTDISRFFGCPADLIEAAVAGSSITYANMTQRNLQFLILNLEPAIIRRETALSSMLPVPRYVKLNVNSLLRMDPRTRADYYHQMIESRIMTPTEAREKENLPPLTSAQVDEFAELFGSPSGGNGGGLPSGDGSPPADDNQAEAEKAVMAAHIRELADRQRWSLADVRMAFARAAGRPLSDWERRKIEQALLDHGSVALDALADSIR
jgi:HK97 family phage portal protein